MNESYHATQQHLFSDEDYAEVNQLSLFDGSMPSLLPKSRICLTCGKNKTLKENFNKHAKGKFGHRAHCIECRAKERKEAPPRQEWVEVSSKICPKCEPPTEKPIDEFAIDPSRKDKHAGWCKACQRAWTNSEEEKARQRKIRKEQRRDPVKGQAKRESLNRWRREHPESQQELTMRRNTRKKNATTEKVSYKRVLARDGYHCYICDKPIDPNAIPRSQESLTFDHVVPIQPRLGDPQGTHSEANLKPAHKVCNARKANKPLETLTDFDRSGVD